jgi:hypothetical protein
VQSAEDHHIADLIRSLEIPTVGGHDPSVFAEIEVILRAHRFLLLRLALRRAARVFAGLLREPIRLMALRIISFSEVEVGTKKSLSPTVR